MQRDLKWVRENVRQASTEDLLDRATVYREGMEPEALDLIEGELRARGMGPRQLEEHAAARAQNAVRDADGNVVRCDFCDRPAVQRRWGWRRMRGRGLAGVLTSVLPLYRPSFVACCAEHTKAR
jgi:hypothetical protein